MQNTEKLTTDALLTQYLNVVNRAIGENKDDFPYSSLIEMGRKKLGDKAIGVGVFKDDADNPHSWYTLGFSDKTFDIESMSKEDPDTVWKVRQSHLEEVVEDPQKYIESPVKLDLNWLSTRIGLN